MNEKAVTIIFLILSLILLVGIVFGVGSVVKKNGKQVAENQTEDTRGEITGWEAITTEEMTTEITTEEETTEEMTTEEVTEEPKVEDDKEAPKFLVLPSSCEIKQGKAFDIQDYVGYGDDVDRNPILSVDGTVDTMELGTYPLTLTLTDMAGRVTTASMNVKVVTEYTPGAVRDKEDFETFKMNYKNENTVLGIDVSRWQEDVDYNAVKNAGCDFVIIRIGGFDDGSQYEDRYYRQNIRNAKEAGLKVGVYWHAEEGSIREVKENVKYMMNILNGEQLDFPIVYDWEDFGGFQNYGMSINDLNNCFETFCEEVKSYGYEGCLYSSKNFLENVWTNPGGHPVWLANYTSHTTYAGSYFMWQQGNTGRIPGINGDVDFDIWYKDR